MSFLLLYSEMLYQVMKPHFGEIIYSSVTSVTS